MSQRITTQVDQLPQVEVVDGQYIRVGGEGGWHFDFADGPPTAEDVAAFAVAKAWFEQHPEAVPDGN